jgi:hypothetical protein
MEVKCLEIRDKATFCPVICIRPVPDNDAQRYLLRRDGYGVCSDPSDPCIILITNQCKGAACDPYYWRDRTFRTAHSWIEEHWYELVDGDVIDVEYILFETTEKKRSERFG